MTQVGLDFDAVREEKAKERGIAAAADLRPGLLRLAREIAINIALEKGEVTADDVQAKLLIYGFNSSDLGNAAGAIFRKGFVWTGRFYKSERAGAHRNLLRVWRRDQ